QILVLNDGECVAIGSYTQLKERGIDLMSYQRQTDGPNDMNRRTSVTPSMVSSISEGSNVMDVWEPIEVDDQDVKAELKIIGSVESTVYMEYIKAGAGPLLVILTILFLIASQVLYQGSVYWLNLWTNEMSKTPDKVDQTFNIIVYTNLISGLFVSALLSTICFYIMCMRSSVNLYNRIFYALLRSPIHVFESSPIGRILNRFSKDTGIVDEVLPSVAFECLINLCVILGSLIVNAIVRWFLIFPAILLLILVFICRYFYIRAARDIKRLEG
ncbi:unnamed protein product, partial [Medioppia subpectinata]